MSKTKKTLVKKPKEKKPFMLTIEHMAIHYLYVMAESQEAARRDYDNGESEDYDFDEGCVNDTLIGVAKVK